MEIWNEKSEDGTMTLHLIFDASGRDGDGEVWRIRRRENPMESEIMEAVERCRMGTGNAELEHVEQDDECKPRLALNSDHGRYLLLLSDGDEAGDERTIRSLGNRNPIVDPEAPEGMNFFQGECFPAEDIVTDFEPVLEAFREFARTGNVSTKLMP
jgi:hypothetical protein